MDLNLAVIAGKLAAAPEKRIFESNRSAWFVLVTTRTERPKHRNDVVPIVVWDDVELPEGMEKGDRVWVAGAVVRQGGRILVMAHHITVSIGESS